MRKSISVSTESNLRLRSSSNSPLSIQCRINPFRNSVIWYLRHCFSVHIEEHRFSPLHSAINLLNDKRLNILPLKGLQALLDRKDLEIESTFKTYRYKTIRGDWTVGTTLTSRAHCGATGGVWPKAFLACEIESRIREERTVKNLQTEDIRAAPSDVWARLGLKAAGLGFWALRLWKSEAQAAGPTKPRCDAHSIIIVSCGQCLYVPGTSIVPVPGCTTKVRFPWCWCKSQRVCKRLLLWH